MIDRLARAVIHLTYQKILYGFKLCSEGCKGNKLRVWAQFSREGAAANSTLKSFLLSFLRPSAYTMLNKGNKKARL